MVLTTISRWPTKLPAATVKSVLSSPLPGVVRRRASGSLASRRATIVVVSFNQLVYTMLCLISVLANTHGQYELIVVDNGSTDGTREYLRDLATRHSRIRLMFNGVNRGFAAATNQALESAQGDVVVLLNNDTVVPPHWLSRLSAHLDDDRIGLVGASTNRSGNEAEIDVPYHTYGELTAFARARRHELKGRAFDIRTATMFCAAMRRDVFKRVGALDERFEVGLFEDDDYSMRVRHAGYRVVCAEDAFVHHFGQASIGELSATGEYGQLFHTNREKWEAKWGVAWTPYERRRSAEYESLIENIRDVVRQAIPADATVAVITRGDEALLDLDGRRAWHFPQAADGTYAGHHPADSDACIAEVERLRAKGAGYLVIPATGSWWLQHYDGFIRHLSAMQPPMATEACHIFTLSPARVEESTTCV